VARVLADREFTGKTEAQLGREIAELLVENGSDTAAFVIVASGPNSASPHHESGERVIGEGDAIVIDFGGTVAGYSADTTRMFHVGEPGAKYREVHAVVLAAHNAGVSAVAPGVTAESVDAAARRVIAEAGYGEYFIHRTGHGIGLDTHEDPYIVAGNSQKLRPGMTFSVEPGVYLPGEFGVRIEDIVACTEHSVDRFNHSSREVVIVG
jgi:Xaa-Pro aminopeptidase